MEECRVCKNTTLSEFFRLEDYPLFHYPVSVDQKKEIMKEKIPIVYSLVLGFCHNCGHISLLKTPPFKTIKYLYENYYTYPSPLLSGIAVEEVDKFFNLISKYLSKKKLKILEIGCFDGYLLNKFRNMGHEVWGCDPSEGADIAKKYGLNVIKNYFSPELFPKNYFDIIIFRNLIEHVVDPADFLKNVKICLSKKGFIALETPNAEFYLEKGLINPFHFEHLSVFTKSSMNYLLTEIGFKTFYNELTYNHNVMLFAKADKAVKCNKFNTKNLYKKAINFNNNLANFSVGLRDMIKKLHGKNKTVAIWGGGGFTPQILALTELTENEIKCIVDNDQKKWGKTYLSNNFTIENPSILKKAPVDYILICSQYTNEIVNSIRSKHKLKSKIITVFPKLEILD